MPYSGGIDVEVRGSQDLAALARALKEAGRNDLRKELLANIRNAGKPVLDDAKATALAELPSRGGLADLVAGSKFAVRSSLSGKSARVTLQAINSKALVRTTDAGSVRHPVWGNRGTWVTQSVKSGWFSDTAAESAPRFRDAISEAMARVAAQVERSV